MAKVTVEVSERVESTSAPYWLVIDPKQMMSPDPMAVANMVTGPFFSREAAERHLKSRSHAFSSRAVVWCHSGCWSREYVLACREAGFSC